MLTPRNWEGRDWFQGCDTCWAWGPLGVFFAENEESGGEGWCCQPRQALRTRGVTHRKPVSRCGDRRGQLSAKSEAAACAGTPWPRCAAERSRDRNGWNSPTGASLWKSKQRRHSLGKLFSKYSKFRLQQSECSFLLSLALSERTPRWFNYVLGGEEKDHMVYSLAAWGSGEVFVGRRVLQNTL